MDQILKFLSQFNQSAGLVMNLLSPGGAVTALIAAVTAIRDRRRAGEEVNPADLDAAIDAFDASLKRLAESNAAYWQIPEKPADPTVPPVV